MRRTCLVRPLDDVASHARDGLRHSIQQRALRLPERELELAPQRVDRLHGLDRVADVYVGLQRDPVQRLARGPSISEVDEVMRGRAQVGLVEVALNVGKAEIERADESRGLGDGGRGEAAREQPHPDTTPPPGLPGDHLYPPHCHTPHSTLPPPTTPPTTHP